MALRKLERVETFALQAELVKLQQEIERSGGPISNRSAESKERLWLVGKLQAQIEECKNELRIRREPFEPRPVLPAETEPKQSRDRFTTEDSERAQRDIERWGLSLEEWSRLDKRRSHPFQLLPIEDLHIVREQMQQENKTNC